ncbi:prephenate dehydratase [Botryobacter ruber]|uniref:prephenate dehydratase n=1 Tax=Botryobacter ruber TaxID=2171629 RepID=UPI000E0ADB9F|nr:prephenate dehydratase domain-containing protein [Botryobacter ruber]
MAQELKIAIQGGAASFHDKASRVYFAQQKVAAVPCSSFPELFETLENGEATYAVMAIENALSGSILTNYSLLLQHDFSIMGELWLPIDQNLMALPGQKMKDIHTVLSHPVALLQCGDFLKHHAYMQEQERSDTAESAREIKEQDLKGVAAIAGKQAAELYGLEILQENIADRQDNFTRFLVLSRDHVQKMLHASADKATLILQLPYSSRMLGAIIHKLYTLKITVSLIQYIPAPAGNTSQNIALDLESNDYFRLLNAIEELEPMVDNLKLLGLYSKAGMPQYLEFGEKVLSHA